MTLNFTDRMENTETDVLNLINEHNQPTLRKEIKRDSDIQNRFTANGVIKDNLTQIYQSVPEYDLTDDFYRGAGVHDNVWNTAIHNFFIDKYGVDVEDIDVIFCVRDHQPHLEISVTKDGKVVYSNSEG
jgi:hypothetical protein